MMSECLVELVKHMYSYVYLDGLFVLKICVTADIVFFFKQNTAYEIHEGIVGLGMFIRESYSISANLALI